MMRTLPTNQKERQRVREQNIVTETRKEFYLQCCQLKKVKKLDSIAIELDFASISPKWTKMATRALKKGWQTSCGHKR